MTNKVIHQLLDIEEADDEDEDEIESTQVTIVNVGGEVVVTNNDSDTEKMERDFDASIDNIKDAIETANEAVKLMFDIAKDKEDHNSFNAVTNLLKSITKASETLVVLHNSKMEFKERKKKMNAPDEPAPPQGNSIVNIDKAVFTGSASQLREYLDKKKSE